MKGNNKISSKRKVYSDTSLLQEIRKISNKHSDFTHKGTRKRKANRLKFRRRKKIITIRVEINEKDTQKRKEKTINEI